MPGDYATGRTAADPIHLKPETELAERVLLPGDPHRALRVAQHLLTAPKMFNHQRGLWGYTGEAADGGLLSVQATGMGGPSAAIVGEELLALGARTLVRIGTCGGLDPELELGALLTASEVIPADGASAALGAHGRLRPDPRLTAALVEAGGGRAVTVVSTDLFYHRFDSAAAWRRQGAAAVEMEAAALLWVARRRGAAGACVLAVSDLLGDHRRRIEPEALAQAELRLADVALAAVSSP